MIIANTVPSYSEMTLLRNVNKYLQVEKDLKSPKSLAYSAISLRGINLSIRYFFDKRFKILKISLADTSELVCDTPILRLFNTLLQ